MTKPAMKGVENLSSTIIFLFLGAAILMGGLVELQNGAPRAEWIPDLAAGLLLALMFFLDNAGQILRTGDESRKTRAPDWAYLTGFGLWLGSGLAFVFLDWGGYISVSLLLIGALGILVVVTVGYLGWGKEGDSIDGA